MTAITPSHARRVAKLVFLSILVLPVAFLAVILGLGGPPVAPHLAGTFFWIAVAASALHVGLSRLLAPRLGASTSNPNAVAFTRLLVAWALCEAAAIFPLVAYVMTADPRLIGVFAVDLLALVLLYPSDARWEQLSPARPGAAAGRMVR